MLNAQNQLQLTEKKIDKLIGTVEKVLFKNEDNGYHVLNVGIDSPKDVITGIALLNDITVTLNHPNIFEGFSYEFEGEYSTHPKFGRQFKAIAAFEILPSTKSGLKAYLSSSFFPGIGPVIAGKIINHFGDNVIDTFKNNIDKLLTIPGISKRKLEAIKDSWEKNKEINDIMMFLQKHGISTLYAKKIYEFYGQNCVSKILINPYVLAKDIEGIGFKYADNIAMQMGFIKDSEERIKASINYVLDLSINHGHCYLYENQLTIKCTELLQAEIKDKIKDLLRLMTIEGSIKILKIKDEQRYYSKKIYYNETYCAEKVVALKEKSFNGNIDKDLIKNDENDVQLSEEQLGAVKGVLFNGISVLTGGAGVGKTQTTKKIVRTLQAIGKNVVLCSPTGKAAKRMTEVIGMEAVTIHRLLGWDPINGGFLKNENNTIEADFIICDEASMIDINLGASLLKAISYNSQLLLIGDCDQIFPVSAGCIFKDIIDSEIVPIFRLNKIYRQGKESLIIKYAHEINSGITPTIDSPLLNHSLWEEGCDCMFIDSGVGELNKPKNEYPKWSTLRYGLDIEQTIIKLYTETIPKYYKDKEIQILIPMNVGALGNYYMNTKIQSIVNPPSKEKNEIKLKDKTFREGDRVMQTRNNYDLGSDGVMNGSMGKIIEIDPLRFELVVRFQDDTEISYKKSDIFDLEFCWACSINKYQGSECDIVILPVMQQYFRMLERRIYYTGITRGKKLVVLVGQRKALDIAVNTKESKERQTSLTELLKLQILESNPLL